ncbi:acylphosphatase [Geodermatophilus arenarius]|uniref:acylphosphatase n=1 Tax=Geodermatophilus arenarius TaxID=1137990 RepID=A0ABV9LQY3_9ACTN
MSDAVRVRVLVSGRVQGVGYRWFVRGLAESAGLSGSARNLPDGRVEVELEGPADDVRAVVAALSGPDAPGRVTGTVQEDREVQGVPGFTTA